VKIIDKVALYIDSIPSDSIVLDKKINSKYKEYFAIAKFTIAPWLKEVDGYSFTYNKESNSYIMEKGNTRVLFSKLTSSLEKKINYLSSEADNRTLSDDEYDLLDAYIDQKDMLSRINSRNRCHDLVKRYAGFYKMHAVSGLMISKYDEIDLYHSWLENEKVCIDLTNNIVMDKKTYYRFVKEKLLELSIEELENIGDEINGYCSLLYLAASEKLKRKSLTK